MNKKALIVAKTKISRDTRILNECHVLATSYPDVSFHLCVLPDGDDRGDLGLPSNVHVHYVELKYRNKRALRWATAARFYWHCLRVVKRLRPTVVHCHDTATVPLGLILCYFFPTIKVIYDDHELPNKPASVKAKIENRLARVADLYISASHERVKFLAENMGVRREKDTLIIENYPPIFTESETPTLRKENSLFDKIDNAKSAGKTIVLHQGVLNEARCWELLAEAIKDSPPNYVFVALAPGQRAFENFVQRFELATYVEKIIYSDGVTAAELNDVWSVVDCTVIMYFTKDVNNMLCAPNRLYIAHKHNVPFFYNSENPSLWAYADRNGGGLPIEKFWTDGLERVPPYTNLAMERQSNQLDALNTHYRKLLC